MTEIENMGQIYKGASLTISAAAANTAEEGFLCVPQARLPIYSPSGNTSVALFTLATSPVQHRGWTFQEQILSPWMLYFGSYKGVLFNCPSGTYRYDGYTFNHTGELNFPVVLPHTIFTKMKSRRSLGKKWADIVKSYSIRRITNPGDRLPALAGVAREFHELCGGNYWAGIWEKFAIRHLGWRAFVMPRKVFPRIRSENIQRPTWSWVSVMDKQLEKPYHITIKVDEVTKEDAKIIEWPVLENGKVDFTQATGGRLILRGKLAAFSTPPRAASLTIDDDWGVSIYYETCNEFNESDFRYFLLCFNAWKSAVGLVLVPDKHDEGGAFLRIGQFRISKKAGEKCNWETEDRKVVIV